MICSMARPLQGRRILEQQAVEQSMQKMQDKAAEFTGALRFQSLGIEGWNPQPFKPKSLFPELKWLCTCLLGSPSLSTQKYHKLYGKNP